MGKIGRYTVSEMYMMHIRADRVVRFMILKSLEPYGLTVMEWQTLCAIDMGPDAGLSMTQVANTLDITLPQVSALTTGLIKKRLVKQKTLRKDRRNRFLALTKKGEDYKNGADNNVEIATSKLLAVVQPGQLSEYQKTISQIASGFSVN